MAAPAHAITSRVGTEDDTTRLQQPVNLIPGWEGATNKIKETLERPAWTASRGDSAWNKFTAPRMQPSQFLIISSPKEKKVVWTKLDNFQTTEGRAFSLIDTGLSEPKGIAFDHINGYLYVADSAVKSIFRYTVLVDMS